jgi:hypothetical protein
LSRFFVKDEMAAGHGDESRQPSVRHHRNMTAWQQRLRQGHFGKRRWGGQRDSNPQQQAPQAWTLPLSYGHHPVEENLTFRHCSRQGWYLCFTARIFGLKFPHGYV